MTDRNKEMSKHLHRILLYTYIGSTWVFPIFIYSRYCLVQVWWIYAAAVSMACDAVDISSRLWTNTLSDTTGIEEDGIIANVHRLRS